MYKRGDIVLIPFPFADLTGTKTRPGNLTDADLSEVDKRLRVALGL